MPYNQTDMRIPTMTSAMLSLLWSILSLATTGWGDVQAAGIPVTCVPREAVQRWHPEAVAAAFGDHIDLWCDVAFTRPDLPAHEACHVLDAQDGQMDGRFDGWRPAEIEMMPWPHDPADDVEKLGHWCGFGRREQLAYERDVARP